MKLSESINRKSVRYQTGISCVAAASPGIEVHISEQLVLPLLHQIGNTYPHITHRMRAQNKLSKLLELDSLDVNGWEGLFSNLISVEEIQ